MTPDRRSCRGVTPRNDPCKLKRKTLEGRAAYVLVIHDSRNAAIERFQAFCPLFITRPLLRLSMGGGLQKYLLIAIGGALGSVARYWVGSSVAGRMGIRFPYGTLFVNITACAILGFSMTYFGRRADLNPAWRFLIPVGFIGAYSTFSTYEWETLSTMRAGALGIGALYALGSLASGLAAVWAGSVIGEMAP